MIMSRRFAITVTCDCLLTVLGRWSKLGTVQSIIACHPVANSDNKYIINNYIKHNYINFMFWYSLYGFTVIVKVIVGLLLFWSVIKLNRIPSGGSKSLKSCFRIWSLTKFPTILSQGNMWTNKGDWCIMATVNLELQYSKVQTNWNIQTLVTLYLPSKDQAAALISLVNTGQPKLGCLILFGTNCVISMLDNFF